MFSKKISLTVSLLAYGFVTFESAFLSDEDPGAYHIPRSDPIDATSDYPEDGAQIDAKKQVQEELTNYRNQGQSGVCLFPDCSPALDAPVGGVASVTLLDGRIIHVTSGADIPPDAVEVEIADGVETFGHELANALRACPHLTTLTLPFSIKGIVFSAFHDLPLQTLVIHSNSPLLWCDKEQVVWLLQFFFIDELIGFYPKAMECRISIINTASWRVNIMLRVIESAVGYLGEWKFYIKPLLALIVGD
jgi:hypothetical protein